MVVYFGAGVLAGERSVKLAMNWEKGVPFVAAAVWPYLSVFLVFWIPLFVFERGTMTWLMKRYVAITLAAGAVFIAFPTAVGLERPDVSALPTPYAVLYALDPPYNAAPSLHVAYAVLILGACSRALSGAGRAATILWLLVLVVSTWLTRQHQLADIVTGALLGGLSSLGSGAGAGSETG